MIAALVDVSRNVSRPIAMIGVIGMLVVSGVTMLDVLGRWLANAPVPALNEVIAMVFAVAATACIPSSIANNGQLRVDLIERRVSERVAALLTALGSTLLLVFLSLMAWRVFVHAGTLTDEGLYTNILRWPIGPFVYTVAGLFALAAVNQLVVTADHWMSIGGADSAETGAGLFRFIPLAAFALYGLAFCVAIVGWIDFKTLSAWVNDNSGLTVTLAFLGIWVFLFLLAPLGAVLGLIGLSGAAMYIAMTPALEVFAQEPVGFVTNSLVAVLPLFLMMGSFAAVAGLADDVYTLAHVVLGRLRGGLALATIGGCAGFGSVTGSSLATTATIGRVALPEMRQRGYADRLATGSVAAGGTLGALVPPSGAIVVYALFTETSIGQLFIAAILPALITVLFYFAAVAVWIRIFGRDAPPRRRDERADILPALIRSIPVIGLFVVVLGGLYTGIFTATESAAAGTLGAFFIALLRGRLKGGAFWKVMEETVMTSAFIYGLIFGALVFAFFVNVTGMPDLIVNVIAAFDIGPLAVIALLLVVYLALGCVMDSFGIMVITLPAVVPVILNLDMSLVWWGIVMVIVIETGLITPPFGINMFILRSVAPDVPLTTVYQGVLPFVAADIVKLAIIVLFPALALWLPSTMFH